MLWQRRELCLEDARERREKRQTPTHHPGPTFFKNGGAEAGVRKNERSTPPLSLCVIASLRRHLAASAARAPSVAPSATRSKLTSQRRWAVATAPRRCGCTNRAGTGPASADCRSSPPILLPQPIEALLASLLGCKVLPANRRHET